MSHPHQERSTRATTTVVYRPEARLLWPVIVLVGLAASGWLIPDAQPGHRSNEDIGIGELVFFSLLALLVTASWAKRLFITRDLGDATLCIEQRRFFFRKRNATHLVQEILDVALEIQRKGKSCSHRIVLVMRDIPRIPITDGFIGAGRHHERAAREIRALLQLPNQHAAVTAIEAPQPTAFVLTAPPSGNAPLPPGPAPHSRSPAAGLNIVVYRPERTDRWYIGLSICALFVFWVVSYDGGEVWMIILGSLAIISAPVVFYWLSERTNRHLITRNFVDATLRVIQTPLLAERHETIHPVGDVQDVAVEVAPGDDDWPIRVVMVRRDNYRIPICGGLAGGIPHHERVAREVRALLQLRDHDAPVTVFQLPLV